MEPIRARKRPTPAPAAQKSLRSADKEASDRTQLAGFTDLPAEIHLLISKQLIYPDALSLKHTSSYFYYLVDTGVRLKVEWLMERRMLHLECPNDKRCDLGSDLRFCRGSVPLLMQRRREHMECESRPGLGCLVYGTSDYAVVKEYPSFTESGSGIPLHLGKSNHFLLKMKDNSKPEDDIEQKYAALISVEG
ncbi:F-box domain-containing protein [Colletotrichum acutatum]